MINAIVLVTTSMGLVAFGGLGYMYGLHIAYDVGGLDVYILFASGVAVGVCHRSMECTRRSLPGLQIQRLTEEDLISETAFGPS